MRLKVTDPEAAQVDTVYLNGKALAMCIEADEEEGWVKIQLPPIHLAPDKMKEHEGATSTKEAFVGDPIEPSEWREKTLYGEVEIVMKEVPGLEDDGLEA